ncbi:hypothetical protein [Thermococcus sp.]
MKIIFDKKYDILNDLYTVKIQELEFDEELKKILEGVEPQIRIRNEELSLSELRGKTFTAKTREEAEKTMSEIRGALVETFSSLIARFREAQSFNGSVVYEIDFNELFKE